MLFGVLHFDFQSATAFRHSDVIVIVAHLDEINVRQLVQLEGGGTNRRQKWLHLFADSVEMAFWNARGRNRREHRWNDKMKMRAAGSVFINADVDEAILHKVRGPYNQRGGEAYSDLGENHDDILLVELIR
jgi:hypothetical protein